MEQLKAKLAVAWKHHFWIGCSIAVIAGLVVYWMGAKKLAAEYDAQKDATAKEAGLTPLVPNKPNVKWVEAIGEEMTKQGNDIFRAWQTLYKQQQVLVFVWPKEFDRFSRPPAEDNAREMKNLLETYQTYVTSTALPRMAQIVGAEWTEEADHSAGGRQGVAGMPRFPGMAHGAGDKTYAVVWDEGDQKKLMKYYHWTDAPSPLDVRFAQEELWVMEAICQAINRANKDAAGNDPTNPFDAVVREIDETLIGYDAVGRNPLGEGEMRVTRINKNPPTSSIPVPGMVPGTPGAAAAQPFDPNRPDRESSADASGSGGGSGYGGGTFPGPSSGGPPPPPVVGGGGSPPGMRNPSMPGMPGAPPAAGGAADFDTLLREGRYVDATGKALHAADPPPIPEYNLMAFRVRVVVDERRWKQFIAELANSKLPLEIRQVRINIAAKEGGGGGDAGGGRFPGMAGAPGMHGGEGGAVMHNISLEVDGVAYLVNPPDAAKLGAEIAAVAAPPAAPAGAPAAPATGPAPAGTTPAGTAPAPPTGTPPAAPAAITPPAVTPPAGTPPAGTPPAAPSTIVPPTGAAPATGASAPAAGTPTGAVPPGTAPPAAGAATPATTK